ncbi:hypothetical protein RSAG8_02598, partial [Rhizoctonia solani AG-8 WAC10335]
MCIRRRRRRVLRPSLRHCYSVCAGNARVWELATTTWRSHKAVLRVQGPRILFRTPPIRVTSCCAPESNIQVYCHSRLDHTSPTFPPRPHVGGPISGHARPQIDPPRFPTRHVTPTPRHGAYHFISHSIVPCPFVAQHVSKIVFRRVWISRLNRRARLVPLPCRHSSRSCHSLDDCIARIIEVYIAPEIRCTQVDRRQVPPPNLSRRFSQT